MRTITINTPGPQGPVGPQGIQGPSGSVDTSFLATTGSNTFVGNQIITGNVTVSGTASISTLVVNQTALSTGSNQLGDAANDAQTLYGTVLIPTGSLTVSGSGRFTNGLTVTGSTLTGTAASSAIDISQTWNTSGTPIALKVNITDTTSAALSDLISLQVSNAIKFRVTKAGYFVHNAGGEITGYLIVGGNSNTYNASAILQTDSTTKGFLPPRTNSTASISSPAQGLMTYLTGSTNEGLYYYNSGSQVGWHKLLTNTGLQSITGSLDINQSASGVTQIAKFGSSFQGNYVAVTVGDLYAGSIASYQASTKRWELTNGGDLTLNHPSAVPSVSGNGQLRLSGPTTVAVTSGNFLIGTTTDAGYKLDVSGSTRLNGNTQITGSLITIGSVDITGASLFRGQVQTTTGFYSSGTGTGLNFYGGTTGVSNAFIFNAYGSTSDVSSHNFVNLSRTFDPTSGTGVYNTLLLGPTINQTGGANGITRGLYVNPTLTSAADFRSIETTAGNVLFQSGSTPLMFVSGSGRVGIGTSTPTKRLEVYDAASGDGLSVVRSSVTTQRIELIPNDSTVSTLIKGGGNGKPFYIASWANGGTAQPLYFGTNYANGIDEVRMTIDTTGSVGIGTITPTAKLHISASDVSSNYSFLVQNSTGQTLISTQNNRTVNINALNAVNGDTAIGTTNGVVYFNTGYNNAFRGNSITFYGGGDASTIQGWTPSQNGIAIGYAQTTTNPNTGSVFTVKGTAASSGSGVLFVTGSSTTRLLTVASETISNILTVSGSGVVGIGASALTYGSTGTTAGKLTISNTSGNNGLAIRNGDGGYQLAIKTTTNDNIGTEFVWFDGGTATFLQYAGAIGARLGASITAQFRATNTDSSATIHTGNATAERFRVTSTGLIGIGTSVPSASLHISSSTGVLLELDSNTQQNALYVSSSGFVGVGTATDNGNKLYVNGTAWVENNLSLGNEGKLIGSFGGGLQLIAAQSNTAQNVRISQGVSTAFASASALLQVDSTTKGFLPPRMTNAQRLAISTPAVGLMVYCTDATEGLYIYKSTGWTFVV